MSRTHAFYVAADSAAHTGLWRLLPGCALQLRPRDASHFEVVTGRVWATKDAPHDNAARRMGDHVLSAGDALTVQPGERLVVEAWGDTPASFDWVRQANTAPATRSRWQADVAVPGRELGRALRAVAAALGRLVWGVAGFAAHLAGYLVAGRGRVLSRFETNPP